MPPKSLTSFLEQLSQSIHHTTGEMVKQHIWSFSQDIVYSISRGTFFTAKHTWLSINKCIVFFVSRNIHYTGFTGKHSFKLKISVNILNFQNSTLGLTFGYISYQMSFKKSMISLK